MRVTIDVDKMYLGVVMPTMSASYCQANAELVGKEVWRVNTLFQDKNKMNWIVPVFIRIEPTRLCRAPTFIVGNVLQLTFLGDALGGRQPIPVGKS